YVVSALISRVGEIGRAAGPHRNWQCAIRIWRRIGRRSSRLLHGWGRLGMRGIPAPLDNQTACRQTGEEPKRSVVTAKRHWTASSVVAIERAASRKAAPTPRGSAK